MLTGGFTSEFEVIFVGQNGELGQLSWTMWVFFVCILFVAIMGLSVQFSDRRRNMEAYKMKGYYNSNMDSYKASYDRLMSARHQAYKGHE